MASGAAIRARAWQAASLFDHIHPYKAQQRRARIARPVYLAGRDNEGFAGFDDTRRCTVDQQLDFAFHHIADFVARVRMARRAAARGDFTTHNHCFATGCSDVRGKHGSALELGCCGPCGEQVQNDKGCCALTDAIVRSMACPFLGRRARLGLPAYLTPERNN